MTFHREPRPCVDCGVLCSGRRCRSCWRSGQPSAPPRVKTHAEKLRRARFVAEWRETMGDWCPGWGRPGHDVDHATNPITADHAAPVAAGGDEGGPLSALCRRCNSSKRDTQARGRVTVRRTPQAEPSRRSRAWYATPPTPIRTDTW